MNAAKELLKVLDSVGETGRDSTWRIRVGVDRGKIPYSVLKSAAAGVAVANVSDLKSGHSKLIPA